MLLLDYRVLTASDIGALCQAITAVLALIMVVIAANAAHRFNRGQAANLHIQNVNHFNDRMIDLAIANKAGNIGRRVTTDSDILADYMHFILLNSVRIAFAMRQHRILAQEEVERLSVNAANFLRGRGELYVNALLSRGYETKFVAHFKDVIARTGGYPTTVSPQPGPADT
jgi:hypothetical protein